MLTFLFWNLNRKPLEKLISAAVRQYAVDVLLLAECNIKYATLLDTLNEGHEVQYEPALSRTSSVFTESSAGPGAVKIFTTFSRDFLTPLYDDKDISIYALRLPARAEMLLVAVHLPSQLHYDERERMLTAVRVAGAIRDYENHLNHKRTLVVGDFNMAPFEPGMVACDAFHAVMDKKIVEQEKRQVRGKERFYFYNPMWSLLGDATPGPSGTYYYHKSKPIAYFWHSFDQVLLRPALLPSFSHENLQVLTQIGTQSLLKRNGLPKTQPLGSGSDHLPLLFRLSL